MNARELWCLLQQVCLGAAVMAVRPTLWRPPQPGGSCCSGCRGGQGRMGCRHAAGLADGESLLLNDGTVLHLHSCGGSVLLQPGRGGGPARVRQPKACLRRDAGGPLPPDRGPEFELHINTGDAPMARSRLMKRFS